MEGREAESNLKGSLVNKTKEPESKLRGSLVKKPNIPAESRLTETLVDRSVVSFDSPTSPVSPLESTEASIMPGMEIVQRDSGETYSVNGFTETKTGKKVNLINSKGVKITLSEEDLQNKLATDGSPWARKI